MPDNFVTYGQPETGINHRAILAPEKVERRDAMYSVGLDWVV